MSVRSPIAASFAALRAQIVAALLLGWVSASAETPVSTSDDYLHYTWQVEQGLPNNNVYAVQQTQDGFLWVGTARGLARFDGVQFSPTTGDASEELYGETIRRLRLDGEGRLWAGRERGGLYVRTNNGGQDFESSPITYQKQDWDFALDGEGRLWTVSHDGRVRGSHSTETVNKGILSPGMLGPSYLTTDTEGAVWLASRNTVGLFEDTEWKPILMDLTPPLTIAPRTEGGVWLVAGQRIYAVQSDGSTVEQASLPWPASDTEVRQLLETSDGDLWLATNRRGLMRLRQGILELIPSPHPSILALTEDNSGNVWVGTQGGGLARVKRREFQVVGTAKGLPNDIVHSVAADSNRVWVATQDGGLSYLADGEVHILGSSDGWPTTTPLCVFPSADGSIWVGTFSEGLVRWHEGQAEWLKAEHGLAGQRVNALLRDSRDRLWIGYHGQGVSCLDGDELTHFDSEDGLTGLFTLVIAQDNQGDILAGNGAGGISRFSESGVETVLEPVGRGGIRAVIAQEDGTLWAGTGNGGMIRIRRQNTATVTETHGLPDNGIFQLMLDDQQRLWCGSSLGLFYIRLTDLNAVADGNSDQLNVVMFGRSDELADFPFSNVAKPACWQDDQGRFWFSSVKGVVSFDPSQMNPDPRPPTVMLESASWNGITIRAREPFEVPPNTSRVTIRYTTPSLSAPERVLFRHRLDGYDADWVDGGTERQATYLNLSPGAYRLEVAARNKDGIWNPRGLSVAFTVTPFFYQTRWFAGVAASALVAIVAIITRIISVRRWKRHLEELQEQRALEAERSRIAHDIHDELGASLTRINLLAGLAHRNLDDSAEVESDLTQIRTTATEAVQAMDSIVWAINPRNDSLEHFAAYVSRYAEEFLRAAGVKFRFDTPTDLPESALGTEDRHQLFLAVREALNNVVKHAQAQKVWIRLESQGRQFIVHVEDDGRGIPEGHAAPGADGLHSMRSRMEAVNGGFAVNERDGGGTALRFTVPLGKARPVAGDELPEE